VVDVGTFNDRTGPRGFAGATYDGRYVFLGASFHANRPARYAIAGSFGAADSWGFGAVTTNRYAGVVSDGRFAYFVPFLPGGTTGLHVARYDTAEPNMAAPAAWESFDVSSFTGGRGFYGAVFDGTRVYLVPYTHGKVVSFAARSPGGVPRQTGSFL
jgi:hypothetical protein